MGKNSSILSSRLGGCEGSLLWFQFRDTLLAASHAQTGVTTQSLGLPARGVLALVVKSSQI